MTAPDTLGTAGRTLWEAITGRFHHLDPAELAILTEACRAKDRLDKLDAMVRAGSEVWAGNLVVTDPDRRATVTADTMKKCLAALRLPDPLTGRRPQYRGPRGVQRPS